VIGAASDWTQKNPVTALLLVSACLAIIRVVTLVLTPLNLGPDEAQYWSWSLYPSFGYFSKPPLIAWLIGGTTSVCGVDEYCIRLSSPFIHVGTAFAIFLAARKLYDERVGLWSAVTYLCIPGTSFSSLLITTDVPLLFFWAVALWSVVEMRTSKSPFWSVLFGVSLGFGLLSKYAMLYFLLGLAVAFLPSRDGRAFIAGRQMLTGLAVGIAVFSPNLIWNFTNGLATVRHTASNASWNWDRLFNFSHIFEFLGAQAGIIGPIAAGIFVVGLIRNSRSSTLTAPDRLMLALSAPVIIVVTLQAFISRANANWAAPAFVTLCILVCAWAVRAKWNRTMMASTAMNVSIALFLCALAVSPALVSAIGQENSVKRLRGWPEAGNTIITIASSAPFTAIMSDDREDMASLFYYTRARQIPLRIFPSETPRNEYEAAHALSTDVASYVLFVTRKQDVSSVTSSFASSERIGSIETRLDSKRTRVFYLYALRDPVTASTFPSK
jgi:4-amino-4-deoxy-L-arabinose transferase-like glycosyltransferase